MKAKSIDDLLGRKLSKEEYDNLESVKIVEGVGNIPPNSFVRHRRLSSVSIPASVKYIYSHAFFMCNELNNIEIPSGTIYIGTGAFRACSKLSSIRISETVNQIHDGAFGLCKELNNIDIDEKNEYYDSRCNCNAIIDSKTNTLLLGCNSTIIPDGVSAIATKAFLLCPKLSSIYIPSSVANIENDAFRGNRNIKSILVDKNNKYYNSYEDCNAIIENKTNTILLGCNKTKIPHGIRCIGDYAFNDCNKLKLVELPNGVTQIGKKAFADCSKMETILMPSSIISIGESAFMGCKSLTKITIPQSIKSIPSYAFQGCSNLNSVKIPEGVMNIGQEVFSYCRRLETIYFPNSIECIEKPEYGNNNIFEYCTNLKAIFIPKGSRNKFEKFLPKYKSKFEEI